MRIFSQFSSVARSRLTLCDPMDCSTPGLPVHHQLLELAKLMSIESVKTSNHLILYRPLLLLQSLVFLSIRVFFNESVLCIRWPKYWSFSFSLSPSNEYSGLISFRIDWLDVLPVQEILKSLLQQHRSKASILWRSALLLSVLSCFSRVQLFATLWTIAHQASLSVGFSRLGYWSGLPFPSPGDLPNPGIEPMSPVAPAL